MTDQYFKEAQDELQFGVHKKGHPFRYTTMGTVDASGVPALRTVVLRQVTDDFKLRIYTDSRSNKVAQLLQHNSTSLLFYHPKKLLQIKVTGTASIITDPVELQRYYSGVQPSSKKDYTTTAAPGAEISNPDAVDYLENTHYFTIIEIAPTAIEFLQLKRPNHIRVAFNQEDGAWNGQFLNP